MRVHKYDIWLIDLEPVRWHEQQWIRPCLIVQNNILNKYYSTTIIVPITSNIKTVPSWMVIENYEECWLSKKSKLLFNQIKTIDTVRLQKKIWEIKDIQLKNTINEKMMFVVDVEDNYL